MPNRDDIVVAARSWLGTRWVHQGRTRRGIDCAGLIVMVGRELEILSYDDKVNYQRHTHGQDFMKPFKKHMDQKPIPDARPGDVLLFRDHAYPCHSSIVAERRHKPTIIHAYAQERIVTEELLEQGDWLDLRVACFEFRGLTL